MSLFVWKGHIRILIAYHVLIHKKDPSIPQVISCNARVIPLCLLSQAFIQTYENYGH